MNKFGLKELYGVKLKATYPMDIVGLHFEPGNVITEFDSLQIANFSEIRSYITARGGYNNSPRVVWDDVKEMPMMFDQGIFNKLQFSLLVNAKIANPDSSEVVISEVEEIESDEQRIVKTRRETFLPESLTLRDTLTGQQIPYQITSRKQIVISQPYKKVLAAYDWIYSSEKVSHLVIGQRFMDGFLALEGRTRVKDDITGQTHTGILKIPKLKLVSDLSIQLGEQANPLVGTFKAVAYPVGSRSDKKIIDLLFLDDDIDSDC